MRYALDASTALSFVLDDERDDTATFMLSTLKHASVIVPVIWRYEVANGLINAVRRKRLATRSAFSWQFAVTTTHLSPANSATAGV